MATPAALRSALPGKPGAKPQPTKEQLDAQAAKPKFVHEAPVGHAGARVLVGCKLPNGFVMKVHRAEDIDLPIMTGGVKVVKEFRPDVEVTPITIHGWRSAPEGITVIRGPVGTGTALTPNVPKDLWERWLAENRKSLLVTNNLVFAFEDRDHVEGKAKELRLERSGLEPLNPARTVKVVDGESRSVPVDPRWPHKIETFKKEEA